MSEKDKIVYDKKEEIVNAITHGIGVILSLVGMVLLLILAIGRGDTVFTVATIIYSLSMLNLYVTSTVYHAITNEKIKRAYRKVDHASIFVFIAGSYTPYMLTVLINDRGISMLVIIWTIAIIGVILKTAIPIKKKGISTFLYVIMGWLIVFKSKVMIDKLPIGGFIFLLAGGILYSVGSLFYMNKKIPYAHAIFHIFVLAASTLQFVSIYSYL